MKLDIGTRIREIRQKFNMPQKTLSELLGIPQSKLSKMENNELSYDIVYLILDICSVFNISVSEFFYENTDDCICISKDINLSHNQIRKLIDFIESLKNEDHKEN